MAKLDPNTIIGILQGKLGDMVLMRMKDGTIQVRHSPAGKSECTPAELVNQGCFKKAVAYVKKTRQKPDEYSVYKTAARLRSKRACDLANADFRYPPAIHDVDLSACTGQVGEVIRIQAVDDFEVRHVAVLIARLDGTLLEHGAAVFEGASAEWRYVTQAAAPAGQTLLIQVTASDRPGNTVIKTVHHALVIAEPQFRHSPPPRTESPI